MDREIMKEQTAGYGTYVSVWLALMLLLAATVILAKLNPFHMAAVYSMTVSTLKALLVLLFFMHLKYEKIYYKLMLIIPFVILGIFIALTFTDTYLR